MEAYSRYFRTIVGHLWSWADRRHRNELAGGNRDRPPVQRPEFASKTVLVPAHADRSREILAALPEERRHRWFRSHRSSQALTQSVFAAVRAFGRMQRQHEAAIGASRVPGLIRRLSWQRLAAALAAAGELAYLVAGLEGKYASIPTLPMLNRNPT